MLFLYLKRPPGLRLLSIDSDSEVQLGPDEQLDAATVDQQGKKGFDLCLQAVNKAVYHFQSLGLSYSFSFVIIKSVLM